MENTTTHRMTMTVKIKDVSEKSSCIKHIGFGTWFNGKHYMVAQYKANPTQWYFFVYDTLQNPETLICGHLEGFSYGREVWQMNPMNNYFYGVLFVYNSENDMMLLKTHSTSAYTTTFPPVFNFDVE